MLQFSVLFMEDLLKKQVMYKLILDKNYMIKAFIFDFGGVIAEEGFRNGLMAIGKKYNLNPEDFFRKCEEIIYESGYVIGLIDEHSYWDFVRKRTGINDDDEKLRKEILDRFILRTKMLEIVDKIRAKGFMTCILSDQTNWLDEINEKNPFYHHFDYIFNSFKIKKSKRDPSVFRDICLKIGLNPDEVIFIDDNIGHIKRASKEGLKVLHFTSVEDFEKDLEVLF